MRTCLAAGALTPLLLCLLLIPPAPAGAQKTPRVYKAGVDGVTLPVVVKEVKPRYPRRAMEARIQGHVIVECVVMPDGTPARIRLTKGLDPALDRSALDAVRLWRFQPGTKEGRPVPVRTTIELTFTVR